MSDKKTEEKVVRARLYAILETAVDAIITINSKGIIDIFNPAAEKLFGYQANDVLGKSINMLMPEPYSSEHDSYLERYEKTRKKKIIGIGREAFGKHKKGNVFPIYLAVGETQVEGKTMYVGIIHDITLQKQQEDELTQHRDHLKKLVEQKTEELSLANKVLQQLANLDGLTKLANRRNFDETLQKELQRAIRNKHKLSLLMCDIDNFKEYNDTYGHLKGDECLIKVADCLKNSFKRASDLAARYGGEEFAVILPHTDSREALLLSETFAREIKKLKISHETSEVDNYITISIGVITATPDQSCTVEEILEAADKELYKAKKAGKNSIQVSVICNN